MFSKQRLARPREPLKTRKKLFWTETRNLELKRKAVVAAVTILPALSPAPSSSSWNCQYKSNCCKSNCCISSVPKKRRVATSPQQTVLADQELLRKILEFGAPSLAALKSCLEVNSKWKKAAAKIIHENYSTHQIIIRSNTIKCVTFQKPGFDPKSAKLREFMSMIENSSSFPCNNFLISTNNLDKPQLQRFFTKHGEFILELKLSINHQCSRNMKNLRLLETLLTNQLPQLQTLSFDQLPPDWNRERSILFSRASENFKLKKLKTLDFKNVSYFPSNLLWEIAGVAVNLREISCTVNEYHFTLLNKLGLITLLCNYDCERMPLQYRSAAEVESNEATTN